MCIVHVLIKLKTVELVITAHKLQVVPNRSSNYSTNGTS